MATPAEKICLIQTPDDSMDITQNTFRLCSSFRIKLLKFLISKILTYATFGLILFYCLRQPMEHYIKNKLIGYGEYYLEPGQINNTSSYLCETILQQILPAWPTSACVGALQKFLPGLSDKIPSIINLFTFATIILAVCVLLLTACVLGTILNDIYSACVDTIPDQFFGYKYTIIATPATTVRTEISLSIAERDIHTGIEPCDRRFSVSSVLVPAK